MSGDFNALGVSGIWTGHPLAGHRTDRHTLGQRDRVASPSSHKKGMTRRGEGREAGKGWEGESGHKSSLVPRITASIRVRSGTHQAHACTGGFLQSPPMAGGRERNPGPPQPQGLTLCDLQHQIRPAPRQGWQAISRTGVGYRGTWGRQRGWRAGAEGDEIPVTQHHRTMEG